MTTPDLGQTSRPASNALFTIDSEDRYRTPTEFERGITSPYNFTINGSRTLVPGFATRIAATEIMFPFVVPNIISGQSDTITVYIEKFGPPLQQVDVSFNQGFYKPSEIAAIIQFAVQTAGNPTFICGYGQTISGSGLLGGASPQFYLDSGNTNDICYIGNTPGAPIGNFKTLYDVMGFKKDIKGTIQKLTRAFNSGITLCQNIRYVDICSSQLTQNQGMPDSTTASIQRDAIVRLYLGDSTTNTVSCEDPLFCPPGCAPFVIHRIYNYPKQMRWNAAQNIGSYISFQVYDDFGNLLDTDFGYTGTPGAATEGTFTLFANCDWNMSLLVSEN